MQVRNVHGRSSEIKNKDFKINAEKNHLNANITFWNGNASSFVESEFIHYARQ